MTVAAAVLSCIVVIVDLMAVNVLNCATSLFRMRMASLAAVMLLSSVMWSRGFKCGHDQAGTCRALAATSTTL